MKHLSVTFPPKDEVFAAVDGFLRDKWIAPDRTIRSKFFNPALTTEKIFDFLDNIYLLDIETNGLFPFLEPVNIALQNVVWKNASLETSTQHHFFIHPEKGEWESSCKKKFYSDESNLDLKYEDVKKNKKEVIGFFKDLLKKPIIFVGHNIQHDVNLLINNGYIPRNAVYVVIDTLDLFVLSFPSDDSYSLEQLAKKRLSSFPQSHTALDDVNLLSALIQVGVKTLMDKVSKDPVASYVYTHIQEHFVLKVFLRSYTSSLSNYQLPMYAKLADHINIPNGFMPGEGLLTSQDPFSYFPKEFIPRPSQKDFINIAKDFHNDEKTHDCMIESPTGTGKTNAYLAHAFSLISKGEKVVISTFTKNLQDQVFSSIKKINDALPENERIQPLLVKGKENYICLQRLIHEGHNSSLDDAVISLLAPYLLTMLVSQIGNDGEAESLLPSAWTASWGITKEDLLNFTYSMTDSECEGCPFDKICPMLRKLQNLKNPSTRLVVTNHFMLMQPEKTAEVENESFAGIIRTNFPFLILDEAHRLAEAWYSINTTRLSSQSVDSQISQLKELSRSIKKVTAHEGHQAFLNDRETIITSIQGICNDWNDKQKGFEEQILSYATRNGPSPFPVKTATLEISTDLFDLYRNDQQKRLYLNFNPRIQGCAMFSETPIIKPDQMMTIMENLRKFKAVDSEIAEYVLDYLEDLSDNEIPSIMTIIENFIDSYAQKYPELGKLKSERFKILRQSWWARQEAFYTFNLRAIMDNTLLSALTADIDNQKKVPQTIIDLIKGGFLNYHQHQSLTVVDRRRYNPEISDDMTDEDDGPWMLGDQSRWQFESMPAHPGVRISSALKPFKKIIHTSATLEVSLENKPVSLFQNLHKIEKETLFQGKVIKLPEVFETNKQIGLCVPWYFPPPIEYYATEAQLQTPLEILRIMISMAEAKTLNGKAPAKFLFLFTSRKALYTVKYILKKLNEGLKIPINNLTLLFQDDSPKNDLIDYFVSSNKGPTALFGLRSFAEGFDPLESYAHAFPEGKGMGNPIRVLLINKIPYIGPHIVWHAAIIKKYERLDMMLKKWIRLIKNVKRGSQKFNYFSLLSSYEGGLAYKKHVLPFTFIEMKQWSGRLIRTQQDKGMLFILDPRLFNSDYGREIVNQVGDSIPIHIYGRKYYEETKMELGLSGKGSHYFNELADIFQEMGLQSDLDIMVDFSKDKCSRLREAYYSGEMIPVAEGDPVPKRFSNSFRIMKDFLLGKKEKMIPLSVFLGHHMEFLLDEDKVLFTTISKDVQKAISELRKMNRFKGELSSWTVRLSGYMKDAKGKDDSTWFAKEMWQFYNSLKPSPIDVFSKIMDLGMGWKSTLLHKVDGKTTYLSQRKIMALVAGIDDNRTQELKEKGPIRTDAVFVVKTGFGKSLCYQVPALFDKSGITVVFSPLKALMRDQVENMRSAISDGPWGYADFLDAEFKAKDEVLRRLRNQDARLKILYVNPTRLAAPDFMGILLNCKINRVIFDEVHTLVEWGDDFSPEYNMVPIFLLQYKVKHGFLPGFYGFTASLSQEIAERLHKKLERLQINIETYTASFNRPDIHISAIEIAKGQSDNYWADLIYEKIVNHFFKKDVEGNLYKRKSPGKVVVFCRYIDEQDGFGFGVRKFFRYLSEKPAIEYFPRKREMLDQQSLLPFSEISDSNQNKTKLWYLRNVLTYFHATGSESMTEALGMRSRFIGFSSGNRHVIISTDAFGMGVDIADISTIIHYGHPESLNKYVQQIGRSRKGGHAWLFYKRKNRMGKEVDFFLAGEMLKSLCQNPAATMDFKKQFKISYKSDKNIWHLLADYDYIRSVENIGRDSVDLLHKIIYEAHFQGKISFYGYFFSHYSTITLRPFSRMLSLYYADNLQLLQEKLLTSYPSHYPLPKEKVFAWLSSVLKKLYSISLGKTAANPGRSKQMNLKVLLNHLNVEDNPYSQILLYDWLIPLLAYHGLVKVVMTISESNYSIGFKIYKDFPHNLVPTPPQKHVEDVLDKICDEKISCRRESLLQHYNKAEYQDLLTRRKSIPPQHGECCDLCDRKGMVVTRSGNRK